MILERLLENSNPSKAALAKPPPPPPSPIFVNKSKVQNKTLNFFDESIKWEAKKKLLEQTLSPYKVHTLPS